MYVTYLVTVEYTTCSEGDAVPMSPVEDGLSPSSKHGCQSDLAHVHCGRGDELTIVLVMARMVAGPRAERACASY